MINILQSEWEWEASTRGEMRHRGEIIFFACLSIPCPCVFLNEEEWQRQHYLRVPPGDWGRVMGYVLFCLCGEIILYILLLLPPISFILFISQQMFLIYFCRPSLSFTHHILTYIHNTERFTRPTSGGNEGRIPPYHGEYEPSIAMSRGHIASRFAQEGDVDIPKASGRMGDVAARGVAFEEAD